jgi:hypothetical protein
MMSPKKKQKQGWQQALTEAELAERVCGICRVPVLLARGQPGEQPPHLNGGRRLAAPVARPRRHRHPSPRPRPRRPRCGLAACFACREILAQVTRVSVGRELAPPDVASGFACACRFRRNSAPALKQRRQARTGDLTVSARVIHDHAIHEFVNLRGCRESCLLVMWEGVVDCMVGWQKAERAPRWVKLVTFLRVRVSARDVACVQTVNRLLVEEVRGCLPVTTCCVQGAPVTRVALRLLGLRLRKRLRAQLLAAALTHGTDGRPDVWAT